MLPLLQRSFKILWSTYTSKCVCMAVLFSDLRTCLSCVFLFYIESGIQPAVHRVDTLVINVVTFDVIFSLFQVFFTINSNFYSREVGTNLHIKAHMYSSYWKSCRLIIKRSRGLCFYRPKLLQEQTTCIYRTCLQSPFPHSMPHHTVNILSCWLLARR